MTRTKRVTTAHVNTSIFARSVKDVTLTFTARPAEERTLPGLNREAVMGCRDKRPPLDAC